MVRITALMDNVRSEHKALIAEHGLSLLLEWPDRRILFDCGASAAVLANAHRLGRTLDRLDAVVLSHSHYDHAAGYRDLLEAGLGSRLLYTGPHFFEPKFAQNGPRYTDLSAGFDEAFLAGRGIERRVVEPHCEIAPGVHLIGGFARTHAFETIPPRFVRQTETGFVPDDFADEICLALDLGDRLAVLVGCSHPGILNMIEHVHNTLQKPVWGVFGGTHLAEAGGERIEATVAGLRGMGLELLGLSHCSGEAAECAVQAAGAAGCHLAVGNCLFL